MKVILKLFSFKLLSSILALGYSILQVRYFGASRYIEVFFAAQSLVYLVTSLSQGAQLSEIFLPEFHKLNKIESGLGFKALNVIINWMLIFGGIVILIIFFLAPWFIEILIPGFSIEDKDEATLMFRTLLPYLFIQVINSFFINVLNAEKRFGLVELLGIVNVIINILILVTFHYNLGIWTLVLSLLVGKTLEFVFYLWHLSRIGFRYKFLLRIKMFDHFSFFKAMKSTFLYVVSTQLYSIVLTASISFLPEGTFAIFKYVQNLTSKIKGLFFQPFITVFFTEYSSKIQNLKPVKEVFYRFIKIILSINLTTFIGTVLLGKLIIDFMWRGNKFTSSDVDLAYQFLLYNILAVFLSSLGNLYRKMAIVNGKANYIYIYNSISQLFSALLAYVLISFLATRGLFFIIPINVFLLVMVSYCIYKRTLNSLSYKCVAKSNIILLLLAVATLSIKNIIDFLLIDKNQYVIMSILSAISLMIYPLYNVYNKFKNKNLYD